jgi:hypothetical protein
MPFVLRQGKILADMKDNVQTGLAVRRWVRNAATVSFLGLVICFLALVVLESRLPDRGYTVRIVLVLCLVVHFAAVVYLHVKPCPACGRKFFGSTGSRVGSFTAMTQDVCKSCGASLRSVSLR